jgi:hypothetical protein
VAERWTFPARGGFGQSSVIPGVRRSVLSLCSPAAALGVVPPQRLDPLWHPFLPAHGLDMIGSGALAEPGEPVAVGQQVGNAALASGLRDLVGEFDLDRLLSVPQRRSSNPVRLPALVSGSCPVSAR